MLAESVSKNTNVTSVCLDGKSVGMVLFHICVQASHEMSKVLVSGVIWWRVAV